jgi:hypothetical protein
MDFAYAPEATSLDPDETAGLIPAHISTQGALNAWEEANITAGLNGLKCQCACANCLTTRKLRSSTKPILKTSLPFAFTTS